MSTNYPGSLDSLSNPSGANYLDDGAVNHADQHANANDAIESLEAKLGTGSSTAASGAVLRGKGVGASAWEPIQLADDLSTFTSADLRGRLTDETGSGSAVFGTGPTISSPTITSPTITGGGSWAGSPTITTPTIASFANSNHDHSNSANGGNLGAVTATSLTTNTISANGANHVAISAGASKLVKTTLLRQDDTTNTYQVGNSVMLTGWGRFTFGVAGSQVQEAVTFGLTFSQAPIVTATYGGDRSAAQGAGSYGSGGNNVHGAAVAKAISISTGGFTVQINQVAGSNWAIGDTVYYQWTAVGEI